MKKTGLGRGLGSLLPDNDEMLQNVVQEISVNDIDPNTDQPRKSFLTESIAQLADSIIESGIIQPLIVAPLGSRYRIVAGERRYRAARLAGLASVPCVVRHMDQIQQMEASLVENLQREDLNPIESAAGIRALMQQCGYTQEAAAKKLGKSRPSIANLLRLLTLPDEIQKLIRKGDLSQGHAKVIAGVEGVKRQLELAKRVINEGLNVRQLEKIVAGKTVKRITVKAVPSISPELKEVEERVFRVFGVRTNMTGNRKQGRIIIHYRSADELDHIYDTLGALGNKGS